MRALLVADNVPWPSRGGGLIRLAQVVEAAASVADLDLFVLHDPAARRLWCHRQFRCGGGRARSTLVCLASSAGVWSGRSAGASRWK